MYDFKNIDELNPSDRDQFDSYFTTTIRHEIGHWLSNCIIIPAYFILTYIIVTVFQNLLEQFPLPLKYESTIIQFFANTLLNQQLLPSLALILAAIPFVFSSLAYSKGWWRTGFKHRALLAFISYLMLAYIFFPMLYLPTFHKQNQDVALKAKVVIELSEPFDGSGEEPIPSIGEIIVETNFSPSIITVLGSNLYTITQPFNYGYFGDEDARLNFSLDSSETLADPVKKISFEIAETISYRQFIFQDQLNFEDTTIFYETVNSDIISETLKSTYSSGGELVIESDTSNRLKLTGSSSLYGRSPFAYISPVARTIILVLSPLMIVPGLVILFFKVFSKLLQRRIILAGMVLIIAVFVTMIYGSSGTQFSSLLLSRELLWFELSGYAFFAFCTFVFALIVWLRGKSLISVIFNRDMYDNRLLYFKQIDLFGKSITFSCILITILLAFSDIQAIIKNFLQTAFIVLGFITSAQPKLIISRQRAYIRHFFSSIRQDQLRKSFSPVIKYTSVISRIFQSVRGFIVQNYFRGGLIIVLILVVAFYPITAIISTNINSENEASLLSWLIIIAPSLLSIVVLYITIWYIISRPRYIVLPFILGGETSSQASELRGVENQIRHELVNQIQQIGLLLQLRQIENLRISSDSGFTQFVASTGELDFTEELRALSLVEVSDENRGGYINRLSAILIDLFAVVKLNGRIQRRSDNTLQIWVELNRRGESYPVDLVIIPQNFSQDLDRITVTKLARELAVKLVLKVGQNYHLGSSWESFNHFVDGLRATVDGNWWRAIESYQTAIQMEEAQKGSFGLGHYHLGSVLVTIGELEEGINHLEQAEFSDPLFADTKYMLAVTKIYQNWGDLNNAELEFQNAISNCRTALKLRPDFAEVYHLMGSAHYHRGKLEERSLTKRYDEDQKKQFDETSELSYEAEYLMAAYYFKKAINSYDKELKRLERKAVRLVNVEAEMSRVFQSRMTATHQLGDALRSQRLFAEADTYYEDFNVVYPNNVRTLTDATKSYCMAGQWQRADEYLSQYVLTVPEAEWNADVNIHVGWMYAGGILDSQEFKYLHQWFLNRRAKQVENSEAVYIKLARRALAHLDYAIFLRPRYITRWLQTEWQSPFTKALALIQNFKMGEVDKTNALKAVSDCEKWLSWRMHFSRYDDPTDNLSLLTKRREVPNEKLKLSYHQYINHCNQATIIIRKIDQSSRLHGMSHAWDKLKLAAESLDNWKIIRQEVEVINTEVNELESNQFSENVASPSNDTNRANVLVSGTPIGFEYRWSYSLFFSISLFTTRWLLEAWAYETAWHVANSSIELLNKWKQIHSGLTEKSKKTNPAFDIQPITPFVFRYVLSMLYAYKSFAAIQLANNKEAKERISAINSILDGYEAKEKYDIAFAWEEYKNIDSKSLDSLENDIALALKIFPRNPLAIFVNAQNYRRLGLLEDAAIEFERLTNTLSPFDPINHIANWEMIKKSESVHLFEIEVNTETSRSGWSSSIWDGNNFSSFRDSAEYEEWEERLRKKEKNLIKYKSRREKMKFQGRVNGQMQLANFVDKAHVHKELSEVYADQQKFELSNEHLQLATILSTHRDLETEYLLLQASRLERLDRHIDARAVSKILKKRQTFLEAQTFSNAKIRQPSVLECIMDTRTKRYSKSLSSGNLLAKDWASNAIYHPMQPTSLLGAKKNHSKPYGERLAHIDLAWLYNSLLGAVRPQMENELIDFSMESLGLLVEDENDLKNVYALAKQFLSTTTLQNQMKLLLEIPWIKEHPSEGLNKKETEESVRNFIKINQIKELRENEHPRINIAFNITVRMLDFLGKESLLTLQQMCELINNLIFNRVELGIDINKFSHIDSAIDPSFEQFPKSGIQAVDNETTLVKIIKIMEWLYKVAVENGHPNITYYQFLLGNYYDTLGWMYFRNVTKDDLDSLGVESNTLSQFVDTDTDQNLEKSLKYLSLSAHYDQDNAIIYYHLARVHIAIFERLWKALNHEDSSAFRESFGKVDHHLNKARVCWAFAKENDKNDRLLSSLNWIGQKIDNYFKNLDERFKNSLLET